MALILLLLCCACACWFLRQWRLQRLTAGIPMAPGMLPFIGHAYKFCGSSKRMWDFFEGIQKQTMNEGGIVKFWTGPNMAFAVTDPKLAHIFLNTFENKVYVNKFSKAWNGDGLLNADAPKWKHHRKLLNPTFNQHLLDEFLVVFNEQALRFMDLLSVELRKDEFDIIPYLERNFLEIICRTALGLSKKETLKICNEEYAHATSAMLRIFCKRFQNIWLHPSIIYNWTKTKREEDKVVKIVKNMCSNVLNSRKTQENDNQPHDSQKTGLRFRAFLDQLLELQANGQFTDQEINDEVNTMIMAGSDTTARTMIFILILLASYPDVQDRLYDEIQEILDGSTRDIVKEDLIKFVYMEAVIKESLRIFPIVPLISRKVDKDTKVGDIFLPAGSGIVVFISALHQNECWGNDAKKFKPERWLDSSIKDKLPAFAPFSLGRRGCIGKNYAMMSMKTFLAHVIGRYRIKRKRTSVQLKCDSLLKPVKGHHISIELRN